MRPHIHHHNASLQIQSIQQLLRLISQHFINLVRSLITPAHIYVRLVILNFIEYLNIVITYLDILLYKYAVDLAFLVVAVASVGRVELVLVEVRGL